MSEKEPRLDGEYGYSTTSNMGNEMNPERTFDHEFALVRFTGDPSDLPEHFKRKVTISKVETLEEGDMLMLNDGHVSKWRHDFDHFHVKAHDDRQKYDVDLKEMLNDGSVYCPMCGNEIWHNGQSQDFISCNECQVAFDIYGKGDQVVYELGP